MLAKVNLNLCFLLLLGDVVWMSIAFVVPQSPSFVRLSGITTSRVRRGSGRDHVPDRDVRVIASHRPKTATILHFENDEAPYGGTTCTTSASPYSFLSSMARNVSRDNAKRHAARGSFLLGATPISLAHLQSTATQALVKVVVLLDHKRFELTAKAGSNLRLLLFRHGLLTSSSPILSSSRDGHDSSPCLVQVLQGHEHLNRINDHEADLLRQHSRKRDNDDIWRVACKTVLSPGSLRHFEDEESPTLVIRLWNAVLPDQSLLSP